MNKEYKIKLDLNKKLYNRKMAFNQFDENVNDFYIEVTKNNEVVKDLDKSIITLVAIKPNNTVDAQFIEVKEGQIYADLKPSMCDLVGNYQAKAMIVLEGEIVTTDTINYSVNEDKIISRLNDDVVSDERFPLFTDALARLSDIEISEEQRIINEAERILSEENRKIEEAKRVEAELIRQHEEADRSKYDAIRESNENIRKQNESIRLANETNRIDEEAKRVEEENKRVEAEQLRKDNYNFMTEDEERRRLEANAHKEAENLRVQAETNRVNEEAKRRTTEQARVSAENTRVNNENVREANEETRQNNETKRIEAETQRQSRYNSFIVDAEANANNFENYTNNAKVKEEERKSNELDRKSQEAKRVSNEVERISNENTRKANEVAREKNETSRQNIFENKVDEVDKKIIEINATKDNFVSSVNAKVDSKISELNTTKDNFVSSVNTKVDNKISELDNAKSDMTTTVSNKVNEVETRFNALTASQQQDAEVIDARVDFKGVAFDSLKERIDYTDKLLRDSTVSTVTTESDFTTVEATSNGYFEDVKLEGKTLVNLAKSTTVTLDSVIDSNRLYSIPCNKSIQKGKIYTLFARCTAYNFNGTNGVKFGNWGLSGGTVNDATICKGVGGLAYKFTVNKNATTTAVQVFVDANTEGSVTLTDFTILEGDHTQNPPSGYIEGLKSVGDGVDEIVVSSVKGDGNLFEILEDIQSNSKGLDIKFDKAKQEIKVNGTCTDDIYFYAKSTNIDRFDIKAKNSVCSLSIDICEGTATIGDSNEIMHISIPNNLTGNAINLRVSDKFAKIENVSLGSDFTKSWIRFKKNARFNNCTIRIMLNKGTTPKPYIPHQSDKKRLLYYNEETQTWEKPILREWDSIEKHANGKYYYHVRSKEGDYIEGDESLNDCITDLTVSVKKLAEEKVYECTNIDLITYANETNYIVNCGAIVPKTTLKVHNNISNVVSLLQKKVSLLESNVKASQEVQDMMILETDMRMLDIELALMEFVPITLNLGGSNMLRSATYFNFLKNHIINETYEKEYLENVMNKYLATGRINQDEYNELYKMLYPPVYDIELPIEY